MFLFTHFKNITQKSFDNCESLDYQIKLSEH